MSHIQGHVDNTNTNQQTTVINTLTTTSARYLKKEEKDEMQKQKENPPIGIASLNFSHDGKTRLIPFLNPDRIKLKPSIGNEKGDAIGFHIYLNNLDDDPNESGTKKYRAYAADIAPWGEHVEAEEKAAPLLKEKFGAGDLLEEYTPEQIESIINESVFEDKPNLKKVLQLTANYMRSFSYKTLYFDEKSGIQLRDDPDDGTKKNMVERNIIKKVIFKIK